MTPRQCTGLTHGIYKSIAGPSHCDRYQNKVLRNRGRRGPAMLRYLRSRLPLRIIAVWLAAVLCVYTGTKPSRTVCADPKYLG